MKSGRGASDNLVGEAGWFGIIMAASSRDNLLSLVQFISKIMRTAQIPKTVVRSSLRICVRAYHLSPAYTGAFY